MRLRRLDLIRYGKFDNRSLDFGAPGPDRDLTVVYGANEAGKSTAYSAWLDLLFGIPVKTDYAFRHGNPNMMVGAVLETRSGPQTLRRRKGNQNTLLDADDKPIALDIARTLLHGLDRDTYRSRFSLDDEELEKGGTAILTSRGDLGRLLYAGASGLNGVSEILAGLQTQVGEFHRKGASTTVLAKARKDLDELRKRLTAAQTDRSAFEALLAAGDVAQRACDQALARRKDAARRLSLAQAVRRSAGLVARRDSIEAELATLPAGPAVPPGTEERLTSSLATLQLASGQISRIETDQTETRTSLAAIHSDPVGERLIAIVAGDADIAIRAATAGNDIPRRVVERDTHLADAERHALQLAGPGQTARDVALPKPLIEQLDALSARHVLLAAATAAARAELQAAEANLATAVLPDLAGLPGLVAVLTGLAARLSVSEAARRTDLARDAAAERDAAFLALSPRPDSLAALLARALPDPALADQAETTLQEAASQLAAATRTHDATAAQIAVKAAQAAKLGDASDVVTDAVAATSRAARDSAWAVHRAALTPATADAFAAAMASDDTLRDRREAGAAQVARWREAAVALAEAQARLRTEEAGLQAATVGHAAARARIETLAVAVGLPPDTSALLLRNWLNRAEQVIKLHGLTLKAETAAMAAAAELTAQARELAAALQVCGTAVDPAMPLPTLRALAEARLLALREADATLRRQQDQRRDVARRQAVLATAEQDLLAWQADWDRATGPLWLSQLAPTEVQNRLNLLRDLNAALEDARKLDQRISAMEADRAAFAAVVQPMRNLLDAAGTLSDAEVFDLAQRRARSAADDGQRKADLQRQLTRLDAAHRVQTAERDSATAAIDAILRELAVPPDMHGDPVAALRVRLDRDRLIADARGLRAELTRSADDHDPASLAAARSDPELAAADAVDELERALNDAERDLIAARQHQTDTTRAIEAALSGTGTADLAQDHAVLVAELAAKARRSAALTLGLIAAQRALDRFREDNRSDMLELTAQAFSQMTGGEWATLRTVPTGQGERLVAVPRNGGVPVEPEHLSKGTRMQLYLALRVAGHARFVEENGPLPFVTDDVMESFDDDRARQALVLTGEMARRGQAILFTHHQHLVDLARTLFGKGLTVLSL